MNLSSTDALSLSLLSLAEYFRTCCKPKVRQILQCLFAILNIPNQSQRMEIRTLMQIGLIYRYYTKNQELARIYLEKALSLSLTVNQFEDVVGQCSSSLADLYVEINEISACKDIIRRGLEHSKGHLFFQCKLLLQISQLSLNGQDYDAACQNLTTGIELCRTSNSFYLEALFLLSKAMIFMLKRQFQDLNDIFARCNQIMEHFDRISSGEVVVSSANNVFPKKDLLFTFSLALHVAHFTASAYATHNTAEFFHWMHNDSLCILVYLLTVVNNVQCGLMEKALKYIDRAHLHIDKLCRSPLSKVEHNFLLSVRAILHENAAICRLVMGNNALAIKDISLACQYCSANSKLLENHRPQLHTLLGMYCMSMNLLPNAEIHFNTVLRITRCIDLWTYVNLNLSICYFNCGREADFCTVLDRVTPDKLQTKSDSIKAASCFVKGLQMFCQNRIPESK
uniref:MAU2 chromatid cohesion factor homolog n=1 Tax=Romanomermis culicivorax TaxID=13658 RepID=A0A915L4H2_ROMCU